MFASIEVERRMASTPPYGSYVSGTLPECKYKTGFVRPGCKQGHIEAFLAITLVQNSALGFT